MAEAFGDNLLKSLALLIRSHIALQSVRTLGRMIRLQFVSDVGGNLTFGMQAGAGELVAVVEVAGVVAMVGRVTWTVKPFNDFAAARSKKYSHDRHAHWPEPGAVLLAACPGRIAQDLRKTQHKRSAPASVCVRTIGPAAVNALIWVNKELSHINAVPAVSADCDVDAGGDERRQ
jgi:hypothetical protein